MASPRTNPVGIPGLQAEEDVKAGLPISPDPLGIGEAGCPRIVRFFIGIMPAKALATMAVAA